MGPQQSQLGYERSAAMFERAQRSLVGGVNSPVRAFGAVGGTPRFVERAEGAYITDVDGNRYVDLVGSWGPMILGHAAPEVVNAVREAASKGLSFGACCELEADSAELILSAFDSCELIRFVNSGTEAVMSAMRLARAATGRSLYIKFDGCYHGHSDSLLVSAGSGAATFGQPDSAGVPDGVAKLTLCSPYNDAEAVATLMRTYGEDVAGVLVEPIAGNMGMVMPADGFLESLRKVCDEHGSLLIFDEVMTGFRTAWGGYQNVCGVQPDVTCLGKVIGGGLPVAAYAAQRELMELVSPLGPMYQGGTLSGNPVGMAAGLATLRACQRDGFYEALGAVSRRLADGLREAAGGCGVPVQTASMGGMLGLFFSEKPVRNFDDARACDAEAFKRFFHAMLGHGVWLPPSPFEAMFVSAAHGAKEIDHIVRAAEDAFREVARS
jgi:glutamate-1-semialdehyde 2,1-aminomutase